MNLVNLPPRVAGWWIMADSSFLIEPSTSVSASNSREQELMQYRFPVGAGPSSKICPKWDPQFLQVTSVRISSGFFMISKRLPPTGKYNNIFFFRKNMYKLLKDSGDFWKFSKVSKTLIFQKILFQNVQKSGEVFHFVQNFWHFYFDP